MAVTTKKKKKLIAQPRTARAKKAAKDGIAGKPGANGKVKTGGQSNKFAANQPPLDAMKDVDPRIPELDTLCESYLADDEKRKSCKVNRDETAGKIGKGLKDNELDCYVFKGKKFYIEPGHESVKVTVVKQGG